DEYAQPEEQPELVGVAPWAQQGQHAWTELAGRDQGEAAHADVEAVEKRGRHHDGEQQAHENQGHPECRIFSAEPQQFDQRIDYHALPLLRATGTTPYCTPCRSKWMKPRSSALYTAR